MFTPFVAIQVQNKQRRVQLENNRIFSPLKNDFLFSQDPNQTSPTRSTKSNQNPMKWSTYSFRQKSESQKIKYSTSRNKKVDQQSIQSQDNKKNLQILIRQSLRRSFTNRNNKTAQCTRTYRMRDNSRSFSSERQSQSKQKQKQDILDYLNQLQGKRCVINMSNKVKSKVYDKNIRRNKSQEPKISGRKQKQQLQIISDFSDLPTSEQKVMQEEQKASGEVIVAIGMAARKKQAHNTQKFIHSGTSNSNTNKIAISTTQCLIFAEDLFEKGRHSGLYIENQANFVRVKKKSNILNKKVAKFKKDEEEQQTKIGDPRIFQFKNNFSNNKNVNLAVENAQNRAKPKFATRKQENIKIEGWEINVNYEGEPAF